MSGTSPGETGGLAGVRTEGTVLKTGASFGCSAQLAGS